MTARDQPRQDNRPPFGIDGIAHDAAVSRNDMMMTPPVEEVIAAAGGSRLLAGHRAREVNSYFGQLGDGLGKCVPPLVNSDAMKPVSIALAEVAEGQIVGENPDGSIIKAVHPTANGSRTSRTPRKGVVEVPPSEPRDEEPLDASDQWWRKDAIVVEPWQKSFLDSFPSDTPRDGSYDRGW